MNDFAVICRTCYDNNEPIVDDCCVHIVDANKLMFVCHNCGSETFIEETKRIQDQRELMREKRIIETVLRLRAKRYYIKRKN